MNLLNLCKIQNPRFYHIVKTGTYPVVMLNCNDYGRERDFTNHFTNFTYHIIPYFSPIFRYPAGDTP